MGNLHVIPTENFNPLGRQLWIRKNGGYFKPTKANPIAENLNGKVNIYITSDEEIKNGDWFMIFTNKKPIAPTKAGLFDSDCKKIILTTDQYLIKDGVQAIDDKFLEWFVKNPSCENVEIKSKKIRVDKNFNNISHWNRFKYEIIIPQEEAKQECIHPERAKEYYRKGGFKCFDCGKIVVEETKQETFIKSDNVDGQWLSPVRTERAWQEEKLVEIFGHYPNASPKWQYMNGLIQNSLDAKQMYSEEEVKKAITNFYMNDMILTDENLTKVINNLKTQD